MQLNTRPFLLTVGGVSVILLAAIGISSATPEEKFIDMTFPFSEESIWVRLF